MPGFPCFFLGLLPEGVPLLVLEDHFRHIYLKNFCRFKNAKCMIIQCVQNSSFVAAVQNINSHGIEKPESSTFPAFTLETRVIYNETQFYDIFTPEKAHLPCYYFNPVYQTLTLSEVQPTSEILKLQKFLPDSDTDSETECQPPKKIAALMEKTPNYLISN